MKIKCHHQEIPGNVVFSLCIMKLWQSSGLLIGAFYSDLRENIGIVVVLPPGCLKPRQSEKDKTHDHALYFLVSVRPYQNSCDRTHINPR